MILCEGYWKCKFCPEKKKKKKAISPIYKINISIKTRKCPMLCYNIKTKKVHIKESIVRKEIEINKINVIVFETKTCSVERFISFSRF